MKLPKELTTVTPLSKYLAMVVFIALPFVGFFLGMRYQEMLDLAKRQEMEANLAIKRIPSPTPIDETANWKTLMSKNGLFSLKYPYNWGAPSEDTFSDHTDYGFGSNFFITEGAYDGINQKSVTYKNELSNIEKLAITSKDIIVDGRQEKEYIAKMTSIYNGCIVFLQGKTDRDAIRISMTFYNDKDQLIFDQILSTFKFTE